MFWVGAVRRDLPLWTSVRPAELMLMRATFASDIMARMTRYFFHLDAAGWIADEEGQLFENDTAAELAAIRSARLRAADDTANGVLDLGHTIFVQDEAGRAVARVSFGDVLQIKG